MHGLENWFVQSLNSTRSQTPRHQTATLNIEFPKSSSQLLIATEVISSCVFTKPRAIPDSAL